MNKLRRLAALLCCLMLLRLAVPAYAAQNPSAQDLLQQMLNYFYHYQTEAKTDIYRLLEELKEIDPEKGTLWQGIFEYWFYATDEQPHNETELPDGLAQDDSLCIVVLGYQLNPYGGIMPELNGRLELALGAAEKYPNAYILCTGGGTAPEAPATTEAHQMSSWLQRQGIDADRIIVESRSLHTIDNAIFSFDILRTRYPQVQQLVIVTSDYHLTRSTTLFNAQAAHTAAKYGTAPLEITACLGYEAGHEGIAEDPLDQTAHLARLSGFEFQREEKPTLSALTDIEVSCDALLEPGMLPNLTVTAHYDTGFSREVTGDCSTSGFDPDNIRTQFLTVTYVENGVQIQSSVEIRRPAAQTEAPTAPQPEPTTVTEPVTTMPEVESEFPWPLVAGAGIILVFFLLRKRK